MPLFTNPFRCFGPTDVAGGGSIVTAAIPCFGAKQVTIRVRANNVTAFTALKSANNSTYLPVADSSCLPVGSVAVCTASGILAAQYIASTTGDSHTGCGITVNTVYVSMTDTSGLVIGQGLTCAGFLDPLSTIAAIPSGTLLSVDRPAIASGGGKTCVGARAVLNANATANSAVPFAVTIAGTPNIATATGIAFSTDGTNFAAGTALIGSTPTVEFKAAVGQAVHLPGGGQFFSACLGSGATAAPTLHALPVPYCNFTLVNLANLSLRGAVVDAWVFGSDFRGVA